MIFMYNKYIRTKIHNHFTLIAKNVNLLGCKGNNVNYVSPLVNMNQWQNEVYNAFSSRSITTHVNILNNLMGLTGYSTDYT